MVEYSTNTQVSEVIFSVIYYITLKKVVLSNRHIICWSKVFIDNLIEVELDVQVNHYLKINQENKD